VMDLRLPAVWLTVAACACPRPADVMSIPPSPRDTDASVPGALPTVDLGPSFEPIGFVPGRFALVNERNQIGMHAKNRLLLQSRASLVLDLGDDGSATACRGWRHDFQVSGPDANQDHRFRVQQGFRGTYVIRDGEVGVTLAADDSLCAEVREGEAPPRAMTMTLRCVLAKPRSLATVSDPVLVCEWREGDDFAVAAFTAKGLGPDRQLVLGGGNGIVVQVTGKPESATSGEPVRVKVDPSSTRIERDAWDQPAPLPETFLEP
jgi:hypothetical protein